MGPEEKMSTFRWTLVFLLLTCIMLGPLGCARVISKEGLARVDEQVTFLNLADDPQLYTGKTVLLGGRVLEAENYPHRTVLVVIQYPLGSGKRPDTDRPSQGRFLVSTQEFLDPAIYRQGRLVTVLGSVSGREPRPIQDRMYVYPVIEPCEIHLWPEKKRIPARTGFHFGVGIGIGF